MPWTDPGVPEDLPRMRPLPPSPSRSLPRVACGLGLLPVLLAVALPLAGAGAQAPRLARARLALHELAHLYAKTAPQRWANATHAVPLAVGETALAALAEREPAERAAVLDHLTERALRARLAILENIQRRRHVPPVPPAPPLAELAVGPDGFHHQGAVVLPVALAPQAESSWPGGAFARGTLVRSVPALEGRPEAIAEALGAAGQGEAPVYWCLGRDPFHADASEATADGFLQWLRKTHGSLRAVNAAWDTAYEDFARVMVPRPAEAGASASRWHDWVAFTQWRLAEDVRRAAARVCEDMPGARVGLSAARTLLTGAHGLSGVRPPALVEAVDVVEATGAGPMETAVWAAFARDRRPLVAAGVGRGPLGVLPRLLHGCAAVEVAPWALTSVEAVEAAERAFGEALDARRFPAEIRALAEAPAPVVLLYSEASLRLPPPWAVRCAETPHTRQLATAYAAARYRPGGVGFVTPAQLAGHRLARDTMVVVAGSPAEREAVVRALLEHAELGGHVVILPGSLLTDERGRESDALLRLGIEVLETTRPAYAAKPGEEPDALDALVATDVPTAAVAPRPGAALAALRRTLRGVGLRQRIQVNVLHEVLATFPDGQAALVSFQRGKGRVTYLAMPLVARDLAAVLEALARRDGARPLVRLAALGGEGTWGVECRAVRHAGRLVAAAWNTTAVPRRVSFHVPEATAVVDLRSGRPLATRAAGGRVVVEAIRLGPHETALVQVTLP